jgi:hypothetical protein
VHSRRSLCRGSDARRPTPRMNPPAARRSRAVHGCHANAAARARAQHRVTTAASRAGMRIDGSLLPHLHRDWAGIRFDRSQTKPLKSAEANKQTGHRRWTVNCRTVCQRSLQLRELVGRPFLRFLMTQRSRSRPVSRQYPTVSTRSTLGTTLRLAVSHSCCFPKVQAQESAESAQVW